MSNDVKDGGQAFPGAYHQGMLLRDYFAGCALIGKLSSAAETGDLSLVDRAKVCYLYADAMLKAREQT